LGSASADVEHGVDEDQVIQLVNHALMAASRHFSIT
jgi:hypothetical protein